MNHTDNFDLNTVNGGFTVFGKVLGNGMDIVDLIAAQEWINFGFNPFRNVPVLDINKVLAQNDVYGEDTIKLHSVEVLDTPAGDYNLNGTVNVSDYATWRNTLGSVTFAASDGNGDSRVNLADYTVWRDTLGNTAGSSSGGAITVPEPATIVLSMSSVLFWGRRKKSGPRMSRRRFDSTRWSGASQPPRPNAFEAPRASKISRHPAGLRIQPHRGQPVLMQVLCQSTAPETVRASV